MIFVALVPERGRRSMIRAVAILAAVDDFLFRSKIRATAKHVDADIRFAQTAEDILAQARELNPTLVIIDLEQPEDGSHRDDRAR